MYITTTLVQEKNAYDKRGILRDEESCTGGSATTAIASVPQQIGSVLRFEHESGDCTGVTVLIFFLIPFTKQLSSNHNLSSVGSTYAVDHLCLGATN